MAFRGGPRQQGELSGGYRGAAYLYPLVSGPKIQNKTMLDEEGEEEAKLVTAAEPEGRTEEPARGRGRAMHAGREAREAREARGARGWAGQATLTELLQLRGHGLGAQREGRGRSPLGGWGCCRGRQERPGVRLAPPRGRRPDPPSRARGGGLSLRLSSCEADRQGRPPGWAGWPWSPAGLRQSLGWGRLLASPGLRWVGTKQGARVDRDRPSRGTPAPLHSA